MLWSTAVGSSGQHHVRAADFLEANRVPGRPAGPPLGDVIWPRSHETPYDAPVLVARNAAGVDSDCSQDSSPDDRLEFEMSEDFLAFIAMSAAHRKQRDKEKRATAKKNTDGPQTGSASGLRGATAFASAPDPFEPPDAAQARARAKLYGDDAEFVGMLEARVNQTHDASVDRHGPQLWPALPILM